MGRQWLPGDEKPRQLLIIWRHSRVCLDVGGSLAPPRAIGLPLAGRRRRRRRERKMVRDNY